MRACLKLHENSLSDAVQKCAKLRTAMSNISGHNPVTLATIAAALGVSRSTVSNAYNHPDQLSPALRQKILDTAASLGYTGPDPVARRLRQRRAGAIGILFSEHLQYAFNDPASVLFLEGVSKAGEEADSGMLLIPARPSQEHAHVVQDAIVDGFILYSIPPAHPFVDAALRRRLPVVCVDQTRIKGVSWVGIDDYSAARQAAQHIVELGHRNVAVLVFGLRPATDDTADDATPSVSEVRLEGYRNAIETAGVAWNTVRIVECERNTREDGASAAAALLAGDNAPTAIVCTSDTLALGVLNASRQANVTVPSQLSVIGFNDIPEAERVGLTTVRQPLIEKGTEAARMLLTSPGEGERATHLDSELVTRNTTAKPSS